LACKDHGQFRSNVRQWIMPNQSSRYAEQTMRPATTNLPMSMLLRAGLMMAAASSWRDTRADEPRPSGWVQVADTRQLSPGGDASALIRWIWDREAWVDRVESLSLKVEDHRSEGRCSAARRSVSGRNPGRLKGQRSDKGTTQGQAINLGVGSWPMFFCHHPVKPA
jgi:hypothetical protein